MKRPTGSHRLYLASSATDKAIVANIERRLRGVVAKLEDCRMDLAAGGDREATQLIDVAILQIKMQLNGIADAELKALCDAMGPREKPDRGLKLVK